MLWHRSSLTKWYKLSSKLGHLEEFCSREEWNLNNNTFKERDKKKQNEKKNTLKKYRLWKFESLKFR